MQGVPNAAGDSVVTVEVEAVGPDFAPSTHALTTAVPWADGGEVGSLRFALHANLPNPFRSRTRIGFDLPQAAPVALVIYDVQGRKVKTIVDGLVTAGRHVVEWDGRDGDDHVVASGVYLCRICSGEKAEVRKLVLLH